MKAMLSGRGCVCVCVCVCVGGVPQRERERERDCPIEVYNSKANLIKETNTFDIQHAYDNIIDS